MRADIAAMYTEQLIRADESISEQEPFSALVTLGAILGTLPNVSNDVHEYLDHQVSTRFMSVNFDTVRELAKERSGRLGRILGGGGLLEYEEVVLVLTIRIELALVQLCFERTSQKRSLDGIEACDESILDIKLNPRSRATYRSAIGSIEKNWRKTIPFDPETLRIANLFSL